MRNKKLNPKTSSLIIAVAISLCFMRPSMAADSAQPGITVTAITAQLSSGSKLLTFSGPVVAREEVMVFANVPQGRIQQVMVEENQKVNAGELLATLDTGLLQHQKDQQQAARQKAIAALAQQEAMLEEAQAQLAQAQTDRNRVPVAPLVEPTAAQRASAERIAEIHVRAARSGVVMAQAELAQADAALQETRLSTIEKLQLQAAKQRAAAALTQQEATLEEAQAQLEQARVDKNRVAAEPVVEPTAEQRVTAERIAEIHIKAARQAVAMAQADLALVDAQIAETDWHTKESAVYAPVAGTVIARKAYRGLVLGQGADPLFVMLRDDALEVELEVPSVDAAKLKLGMPAEIQMVGDSATYAGKVRRAAGQVNRQSQVATVRVSFDQHPPLIPGQFARVSVSAKPKKAVYLPESAIRFEGTATYFFSIVGGKVKKMPIKLGERGNGLVEALSGVAPGTGVVTGAVAFLHDGEAVRIAPEQAIPSSLRP